MTTHTYTHTPHTHFVLTWIGIHTYTYTHHTHTPHTHFVLTWIGIHTHTYTHHTHTHHTHTLCPHLDWYSPFVFVTASRRADIPFHSSESLVISCCLRSSRRSSSCLSAPGMSGGGVRSSIVCLASSSWL